MWSDLQSYAAAQNPMTVALFKSFSGAIQALSTQTPLMSIAQYDSFMTWITSFIPPDGDYIPVNTDAQSILDILASFTDNYLNFTQSIVDDQGGSFETYIQSANDFINEFAVYCTKMDLPGQLSLPDIIVSNQMQVHRTRNFPYLLTDQILAYNTLNISLPSYLPYDNSYVLNMRAFTYSNTGDYSPIVDLSYAISGTYQNFIYTE
jgi:hypothetical protein